MLVEERRVPDVTLRYFDECPHWRATHDLLVQVLRDEGLDVEPRLEAVGSDEEAERQGFVGSPTILIDGRDPFPSLDEPTGLSCRIFQTPNGPAATPTYEQLQEALQTG
jgi:hypothetical protein